jgi:hypothetical protein
MPTAAPSIIHAVMHRVERIMLRLMRSDVRHNVWTETFASMIYGIFWAVTVGFMPVVLRKMGATESELAIYVVFQSLGLVFTPISAMLFQRYRIIKIANGICRGAEYVFAGATRRRQCTAVYGVAGDFLDLRSDALPWLCPTHGAHVPQRCAGTDYGLYPDWYDLYDFVYDTGGRLVTRPL